MSNSDLIRRLLRRRVEDQRGMTLVETIVSMALMLIVILTIGGLVNSSITVTRTAQDRTRNVTDANTIAQSVQNGVNDSYGLLTGEAARTRFPGGSDTDVNAVVALTRDRQAGTWQCRAWAYEPSTKTLWSKVSTVIGQTPAGLPVGSQTGFSRPADATEDGYRAAGWQLLAGDVTPQAGHPTPFAIDTVHREFGEAASAIDLHYGIGTGTATARTSTLVSVDSGYGDGDMERVGSTCRN
ncbi:prepilin-type N-terminal cleavage/methylation domain-containing protein [Pseudoclavibacter sp. CFCC 13796]|uniref:prepilin-type N-terminal cleavage/methylation domain-containing protein n=1 Tax=Pseudoclavibacter sp. CFCC 13796 TaxID=2615179 RepID=UPI001301296E|nr:prepilin-type N-terminal cleavage/methylation domain-containing protein [Pseudoclavibacter sp. CFCC 13796]KAB1661600.1 prepilin-type N-terminal cleavage/methylation domain-containing protein [Pseudoclavibacter sp. CFCC 13796]